MNKKFIAICSFVICPTLGLFSQIKILEGEKVIDTYQFSDPNMVALPSNQFYPYFRFDGFTSKSVQKKWKFIDLENDYIKISLCPEIGGKVWSAIDKSTGKPFIYEL